MQRRLSDDRDRPKEGDMLAVTVVSSVVIWSVRRWSLTVTNDGTVRGPSGSPLTCIETSTHHNAMDLQGFHGLYSFGDADSTILIGSIEGNKSPSWSRLLRSSPGGESCLARQPLTRPN